MGGSELPILRRIHEQSSWEVFVEKAIGSVKRMIAL